MTDAGMEQAIDALRKLSIERQRELADYIRLLAEQPSDAEDIDPLDSAAVTEGIDEANRGLFARAEDIEAVFRMRAK